MLQEKIVRKSSLPDHPIVTQETAMTLKTIAQRPALTGSLLAALCLLATSASAIPTWTDWDVGSFSGSTPPSTPGLAVGVAGGVNVKYSGELGGALPNTIWNPSSSFVGGAVTTPPPNANPGVSIRLDGNFTGVNTLTFDSSVQVYFAIWSLGSPGSTGVEASFIFDDAIPTFQAGGPNALFDGEAVTVIGNTVSGREGNGVVRFAECRESISWTNTPESFYGFTVGIDSCPSIPEPASLALLGIGLTALLALRRRNVKSAHRAAV